MARIDLTDQFVHSLGYESYRVGGSVRDEVIGRKAKDADYLIRNVTLIDLANRLANALRGTEPAPGEAVILPKAVSALKLRTGEQIGWRVHVPKAGLIEIALPRSEVSTGEGRHAFDITVDPEIGIAEDAKRRDFTFNALYKLLPDGPIADPTSRGLYDLQHKLVNVTHDSSLGDDPLRALRALRFVATLGFELGTNTRALMTRDAAHVTGLTQKGVSGTVLDELTKLLMGANAPEALRDARDTGVLEHVLPELKPMLGFDQGSRYHDLTTDEHTFKALETAVHVDAPLRVRLALLFHDAGKPATAWVGKDGRKHYYATKQPMLDGGMFARPAGIPAPVFETRDHEDEGADLWLAAAERLNVPKELKRDVETLIRQHMVSVSGKIKATKVARQRIELGDPLLRDLYLMRMCDISGKAAKKNLDHLRHIAEQEQQRGELQRAGVPRHVTELQIDGNDLKVMGYEGRQIGDTLRTLLDEVACQPKLNDRDWLIEQATTRKSE